MTPLEPASLPKPPAVARVLQRVAATARRHGMFDEPPRVVLVAVSGGPDSVCLLHALVRLRRLFRIRIVAFHFDHRLREGSDADARYAKRQAESLGVAFVLRAATSSPERGESVEAWARIERYRAMAEVREEVGARISAVGHTADDQAETVLLALVRGGGLEALSGMRPLGDGIARPLLEVTREETAAFCRALHLRPRHDPMNDDPSYLRIAIRSGVIPSLEEVVGRGVRSTLVRTAANLRADADLLAAMAIDAERTALEPRTDGVALRVDAMDQLPPPISARVARTALRLAGVLPESAHVDAILDLIAGRAGRKVSLPGRVVARREREYVSLSIGAAPEGGR